MVLLGLPHKPAIFDWLSSYHSEGSVSEALGCLAGAVQHGQAEAEVMACNEVTATQWIEINFSHTNNN